MSTAASPAKRRTRDTWTSQTGFLMAAIGSAIGLGNIWRFPGVAYTNGGGAFLVPYLVALLFAGIPILWLEYAVGHKFRGTPPWAFRRMNAKGEFLGWLCVFICFVIITYYAAVVAWSGSYVFYSITEAWGEDSQTFFLSSFLGTVGSDELSWTPVAAVAIPLVLVWACILLIASFGVARGVEKANKIFLPLLVVLFLALVVRALFLPGALEGLSAFFTPNWSSLAQPKVWLAAFAQIFFSLSVGFGIMLTYASYLQKKSNVTGTALVAGFANSSFEILAGIGVFSALGFMAHSQGIAVSELKGLTGPILSFVTFPKIISMMPGGPLFGVLFFSSLVLAGITSLLSLLQVVSGAIQDKFALTPVKASLVMGIPTTIISLALFATRSGLNTLDIVDNFINNVGVVGCAIAMTLYTALVRPRLRGLRTHLNSVSAPSIPPVWDYLVGIVIPLVLAFMLVTSVISSISEGYGGYAGYLVNIFGWGSVGFALLASAIVTLMPWSHPHRSSTSLASKEIA